MHETQKIYILCKNHLSSLISKSLDKHTKILVIKSSNHFTFLTSSIFVTILWIILPFSQEKPRIVTQIEYLLCLTFCTNQSFPFIYLFLSKQLCLYLYFCAPIRVCEQLRKNAEKIFFLCLKNWITLNSNKRAIFIILYGT